MTIQNGPYIKNKQIWYCPSDKVRSPSPGNIVQGLQSFRVSGQREHNELLLLGERHPGER